MEPRARVVPTEEAISEVFEENLAAFLSTLALKDKKLVTRST
jgi:hypothetical protein